MSAAFRLAGRSLLTARSNVCSQARNSSYKPDPNWKPAHLDEMPVPQGSWKSHYDAKQKNYNMQLAAGVIIFASTVTYIVTSDRFFFNATLPPLPKD